MFPQSFKNRVKKFLKINVRIAKKNLTLLQDFNYLG